MKIDYKKSGCSLTITTNKNMKNLSNEVSSFFWEGGGEKYYGRQISEHSLTEGLYARSKKVHKSVILILKHHNTQLKHMILS